MYVAIRKRKITHRVPTNLQVGDILRWIPEDRTAAFYRPDASGCNKSLYVHKTNDDKFRFGPMFSVAPGSLSFITEMIADACGLDCEPTDGYDAKRWVAFKFTKRK